MSTKTDSTPTRRGRTSGIALVALLTAAAPALTPAAADWTHWRGPQRDGTSPETDLVEAWSLDGENLLWRVDFIGRSTPLVIGDRVCANGRAGEGIDRQEVVACYDVANGDQLWERRFNVYHTTVPWTRAGWPNPAIDPETGYLYVQGVGGDFRALDTTDGRVVWERDFMEEFGFMEGYGGRTQTPLVDGDRVIVTFSSTGWGSTVPPRHRIYSFDKRTGELIWFSTPGTTLKDKNSQSTPVVATVNGTRLIMHGNGDGHVYAVKAGTGEPVWDFHLSQRGINTSAVLGGTTLYISHSEENIDEAAMGRVVAIDITGSGDVTSTHEVWRAPIGAGFSSPALADGKLYVLDNSANLHVLDAATGAVLHELDLGRVGKASPVVADGKLYVTEVNGQIHIVDLSGDAPAILDTEKIRTGRRWAETYSSVAISDGRIFFATEEGLYAIGSPNDAAVEAEPYEAPPGTAGGDPAALLLVPAEVIVRPGDEVQFTAHLAGQIFAERRGMTATARVRVVPDLPLTEDYEAYPVDSKPPYQVGYLIPFKVTELDGNKVLVKEPSSQKIHRHISFLGAPDQSDYTIEADLLATASGDTKPDLGLINSGYTLEMMGQHQLLEFRSWHAARRMYTSEPFSWQHEGWYRKKIGVTTDEDAATLRGQVWDKGKPEQQD